MKLEVGKYYKCRNGEIVGPLILTPDDGSDFFVDGLGLYQADGIFGYMDGGGLQCGTPSFDLIEEVPAPESSIANPYRRTLPTYEDGTSDIYCVLKGYNVTDPAIAHAVKKLLAPGCRSGGKSYIQDLEEAMQSIQKAIDLGK